MLRKVLRAFDGIAVVISFLAVAGIFGLALLGAIRHISTVAHRLWREANTEDAIIWSVIACCFVWVALRWKRLNKR